MGRQRINRTTLGHNPLISLIRSLKAISHTALILRWHQALQQSFSRHRVNARLPVRGFRFASQRNCPQRSGGKTVKICYRALSTALPFKFFCPLRRRLLLQSQILLLDALVLIRAQVLHQLLLLHLPLRQHPRQFVLYGSRCPGPSKCHVRVLVVRG